MPRNITAAQRDAWDFHKSGALAQTNQINKVSLIFFAWYRKHEENVFSRYKIRNKNPGHVFLDFTFFKIAVEKSNKK